MGKMEEGLRSKIISGKISFVYQKQILNNGITVLTMPMESVETVTALVVVRTGSRHEVPQHSGISHFLEHMAFKGTEKRPSTTAIASLMDSIGAEFNAYTGKEYTGFYVKCLCDKLDLALDVLSDILKNSLIKEEELEREKNVIVEEINMYEDIPTKDINDVFESLVYGQTSLGRKISGTAETVRGIGRSDILRYIQTQYTSQNMVVGIAGKVIGHSSLATSLETFFGNFKIGKENNYQKENFSQSQPAIFVKGKKTDQAHFMLGVRALEYNHPDRFALSVLNTILGGSMSSRLWIELRERRGLCYYIHSGTEEYLDNGYWAVGAGVTVSKIEEAVKLAWAEMEKLRDGGVSVEELQRAKDNFKGKMAIVLEDSHNVASAYVHQQVLKKEILEPEEIIKRVEAVTLEDVSRIARDVIKRETFNLAVIGPYENDVRLKEVIN